MITFKSNVVQRLIELSIDFPKHLPASQKAHQHLSASDVGLVGTKLHL